MRKHICSGGVANHAWGLFLALCLSLSLLTGCTAAPSPGSATGGDSAAPAGPQAEEKAPGVDLVQAMEAMDRPLAEDLTQQLSGIGWAGLVDGAPTLYAQGRPNAATGQAPHLLVTLDVEKESYTRLDLTLPPVAEDLPGLAAALDAPAQGAAADRALRSLAGVVQTDQGPVAVLDDMLLHTAPEESIAQVTERALTLCTLAADGALQPIARLQLPQDWAPDVAVENLFLGRDATLWLTVCDYTAQSAALLGFSLTDGSLQRSLPLPEGAVCGTDAVAPLADGRLLVLAQASEGPTGMRADRFLLAEGLEGAAPHWLQPLTPPQPLDNLNYSPRFVPFWQGEPDVLLLNTGDALVRWDLAAESAQTLYNWWEFSVDATTLAAAFGLPDGRSLVATFDTLLVDAPYRLQILTPLDPAALADRTILTFATTFYSVAAGPDPIKEMINAFNANQTEYYIQTIDWTNRYLGDQILNRELPDIIMVSSVESSILNKGVFIDLYPLLDADPDLARTDFVSGVVASTEVNGQLPTIVPAYALRGLLGASADVGDDPGWTLEECYRLSEKNPAPFWGLDKTSMLRFIVQNSGTAFVDWAQGQAHFDTPAYARLLAFCASQPDIDASGPPPKLDADQPLADGKPLLLPQTFFGWGSLNLPRHVYTDGYTLVGYPTPDGAGTGTSIIPCLQFAITHTCQHPDAAWQLVRQFLLPTFQDKIGVENGYVGLPLRRDSLQAGAALVQTLESVPSSGTNYFSDDAWPAMREHFERPLSAQDTDKLIELVENTTTMWNTDITFFGIIEEEAQAYYHGVRSAEEAARITQERMQTYLAECS